MIIDAHLNLTEDGAWFNTCHNASLERLLDEMARAAIDKGLLIAMPGAVENRYIASIVDRHPDKFRALGHLCFDQGDLMAQADEIFAMGLAGIKIHPRSQGIDCNDEALAPLFRHLNERAATVMIDGYYQTSRNTLALSDLTPLAYDRLAKRYPNLRMIISHMGAHRAFDLYFVAKSNANVYIDCSHALKYFEGTSLIQDYLWIMDKLDEKIIYGSDFPEYGLLEYRRHFEAMAAANPAIRTELIFNNIRKLVDFGADHADR